MGPQGLPVFKHPAEEEGAGKGQRSSEKKTRESARPT